MTAPSDLENDVIDLSGAATPPEEVTNDTPTPEQDQPQDAPEETPSNSDAAPVAPAQPDFTAQLAQLTATMQQDLQARHQREEQARQAEALRQQEAARPKPLMEQDEWRERYEQAATAMSYDADARRQFAAMNQELAREQATQMMSQMRGDIQYEMRSSTAIRDTYIAAQGQYGNAVTEADVEAAAARAFGQDRAGLARALDPAINPGAADVRQFLADAAFGVAYRAGRVKPASPATPPPNPRSAARTSTPAKTPTDPNAEMWNDRDWLDQQTTDLWRTRK